MIKVWSDFIRALGLGSDDSVVKEVFRMIGESPVISETPDDYEDSLGKTKYFKFTHSGLEVGFRLGRLNHIHFFVQAHEGYLAYQGDILDHSAQFWCYKKTLDVLGGAHKEGVGGVSQLVGYINPWVRYEFGHYAVRMEFSQDGSLWSASLMLL